MKEIFNKIAGFFRSTPVESSNEENAFEFTVDVPTEETGELVWVEKGRHRIQVYEGELKFYNANGWKTI